VVVSVTDAPLHITPSLLVVPEVSVKLITGLGNAFTVTVAEVWAEQPVLEFVTVTV
jgi:hypothetical protein